MKGFEVYANPSNRPTDHAVASVRGLENGIPVLVAAAVASAAVRTG